MSEQKLKDEKQRTHEVVVKYMDAHQELICTYNARINANTKAINELISLVKTASIETLRKYGDE